MALPGYSSLFSETYRMVRKLFSEQPWAMAGVVRDFIILLVVGYFLFDYLMEISGFPHPKAIYSFLAAMTLVTLNSVSFAIALLRYWQLQEPLPRQVLLPVGVSEDVRRADRRVSFAIMFGMSLSLVLLGLGSLLGSTGLFIGICAAFVVMQMTLSMIAMVLPAWSRGERVGLFETYRKLRKAFRRIERRFSLLGGAHCSWL